MSRLFAFEFFQGSAIALFFTAAISIFLEHRSTADFPQVFILSAILLWVFGFIYSRLEHRLSASTLILSVLIFNISAIVLFRFLMVNQDERWFLYIFLASFNVLYLLNNLEFWGLAAVLFDVRQSKRLFGIISAGDIPAKMLGYLSAAVLVPFIGAENLLWLAAAFLAVSFIIYKPLMKLSKVSEQHHKAPIQHSSFGFKNIKTAITGNSLVRTIALISFFSFCCFIIVNFVFYGYIKSAFRNDRELAGFFAVFLAIIRGITLVVKLGVTNRMVDKIGLRKSLLITPVISLIICCIAIYFSFQQNSKAIFYLFGMMAVTMDVLRSAIQSPVLLAAMQPLPTHQRLRGHTIVKGLMDPFAFFTMGILLWALPVVFVDQLFAAMAIVLLVLIGCWILFAMSADKNYIQTLQTAIRNRTLNPRDISITDKESLNFLLQKLKTGSESEAISVLQLIGAQPAPGTEFFGESLSHPSYNVKLLALKIIQSKKIIAVLPLLKNLLKEDDHKLLPQLIHTVASLGAEENMSSFLEHNNSAVRHAATLALLKQTNSTGQQKAEMNLKDLFSSAEAQYKINALQIVGELKSEAYAKNIMGLLNDQDASVQQAARIAAARIGNEELIHTLLMEFFTADKDAVILAALAISGQSAVPVLKRFLLLHRCSGIKCRKLIALLGKIGGESSVAVLDECLDRFPENADAILPSLHQANIHGKGNHALYQKIIRENLQAAAHILFQINFAQQHNGNHKVLTQALELELAAIRNKCLWLFSFMYDAKKINKAQAGFKFNSKESVANAIELIQVSVPREFSAPFSITFENSTVPEKCTQLTGTMSNPNFNETMFVKNILFDVNHYFNSWTKSCVLYGLRNETELLNIEFIEPFCKSENKVLKDTAEFILARARQDKHVIN